MTVTIRSGSSFEHPQKERTRQFIRHLKVLEYSITSKDFDFIGFNTQIEEFGRKHRVSQRTIYNIQSYIEEMCVQILLPQMQGDFEILVTIEYSEEKDDADVVIRYSGDAFDPLHTDNELSLLLAQKAAESGIVGEWAPTLMEALALARAKGNLTVVCGSLYLYKDLEK